MTEHSLTVPTTDKSDPGAGAEQALLVDIDVILARLEIGIAAQQLALDALLHRLAGRAA